MDVAKWDRLMAVNLRGPMLAYKYAGRQMIKQERGGRLIGRCNLQVTGPPFFITTAGVRSVSGLFDLGKERHVAAISSRRLLY